jgi:uroporphyrinogen III methyltransferase/synthase
MTAMPGQRVVLTRSREDCEAWAERLSARGLTPIRYPCIACEFIDTPGLRAALNAAGAHADWLLVTARRGVEAAERLLDAGVGPATKIGVVGEATAHAAGEAFGRVDLVGAGTAAALADGLRAELPEAGSPPAVLLAVAANAGDAIAEGLAGRAVVQRLDVYRTVPCGPSETKQRLSGLAADAVFFASPSAVTGFVNRTEIDADPRIVTIGPSTSDAVRRRGLGVAAEAGRPTLEGLMECL